MMLSIKVSTVLSLCSYCMYLVFSVQSYLHVLLGDSLGLDPLVEIVARSTQRANNSTHPWMFLGF